MTQHPKSLGRLRSGLSLIEVMINLVIVSMLMLAVAMSLRSMLTQYRGNETALRARQTATVALEYILAGIRQAKDVNLYSTPTSTAEIVSTRVTLLDYFDRARPTDTKWRTFSYDAASKTLKLSVNGAADQIVLQNIADLKFRAKPELDTLTNVPTWRTVTIDVKVEAADMAGKVVPWTFSGTTYARSVPLS